MQPEQHGRYHDDRAKGTIRAPGEAPGLLDYLRGSWRIERRITDHASGGHGEFRGRGEFTVSRDPAGLAPLAPLAALAYEESGELRFGDYRGPAGRRLIYAAGPDGTAEVRFADGRAFYRLAPDRCGWRADHPCDRDHYEVTGRFLGPDLFREHWRALGPDQDYEIATTFARPG